LFTIGTVGAGAAAGKMGKLTMGIGAAAAAAVLLSKELVEMINKGVRFQQVVDAVNIPLGEFNRRTAGLVDTMATYQAASKLQNAQVKISEEQFAALGVAATKAAQAAGEGPEGATTRFNRLTKAIISGRETALKEYGIEVSQTTDLIKFQAEALEKLTGNVGDFVAEAKTAEEQWSSFGNTLGTVIDFRMAQGGDDLERLTDLILGGSGALSQWEQDLISTKGELAEYYSILGDSTVIEMAHDDAVWESIQTLDNYDEVRQRLIDSGDEGAAQLLDEAQAYRQIAANAKMAAFWASEYNRISTDASQRFVKGATAGVVAGMKGLQAAAAKLAPSKKPKKGGAKRVPERLGFEQGDPTDIDLNLIDDIFATPEGDAAAARADEATREMRRKFAEKDKEDYFARQALLIEQQRSTFGHMLGLESEFYTKKKRFRDLDTEQQAAATKAMVSTTSSTFSSIADTIGASSEEAFNAQKAFLIPAAIMEGTMAAIAGFRSVMTSVPYPANIILAPLTAAAVAAATAKQVATIAGQKYGKKSGRPKATGSVNMSAGSLGSASGGGETNIVINNIVEGQTIHEAVFSTNRRNQQNGGEYFTTGAQ
jgi:hypothetical protein